MHLRKKKSSFLVNPWSQDRVVTARTEGCHRASQREHQTQPGRAGEGGQRRLPGEAHGWIGKRGRGGGRRDKGRGRGRRTIGTERLVFVGVNSKGIEKTSNVKVLEASYGLMLCYGKIHTTTFTITAMFKCTILWYSLHSKYCASITTTCQGMCF